MATGRPKFALAAEVLLYPRSLSPWEGCALSHAFKLFFRPKTVKFSKEK